MEIERSMILSIPELRLGLNVLGCTQWDDLPLLDTGDAVEQRMLNAFLQLIQKGCFCPQGDKYVPDRDFSQMIRGIGRAERVHYLYAGEYVVAFLYEKGQIISVVSPDWGKREQCRISVFVDVPLAEIQMQFSVLAGETIQTNLKEYSKPQADNGTYNLHELSFFMGDYLDWEEA